MPSGAYLSAEHKREELRVLEALHGDELYAMRGSEQARLAELTLGPGWRRLHAWQPQQFKRYLLLALAGEPNPKRP